jgi:hypothetical protein
MTNGPHSEWVDADLLHEIQADLVYLGDDDATRRAIVSALVRLPDEVRNYVLWRCRFLSVGGDTTGYVVSGAVGTDPSTAQADDIWLIVLSDAADDLESVVASQVARAWLRRCEHAHSDGDDQGANEQAAEALSREWGFTVRAANGDRPARESSEAQ